MLKRIIDESSWGKYDFMYLRIDFANDCKYVQSIPLGLLWIHSLTFYNLALDTRSSTSLM